MKGDFRIAEFIEFMISMAPEWLTLFKDYITKKRKCKLKALKILSYVSKNWKFSTYNHPCRVFLNKNNDFGFSQSISQIIL